MWREWKAWGYRLLTGEPRGLVPGLARGLLTVASWGYGLGVRVLRALYDVGLRHPTRMSRPVISVGNLTWGGTGKTPLVAHLASALHARGFQPAIVTRGYGGDEPKVLQRLAPEIPVVVGTDRVACGWQAIAAGADLLLLDDGFQTWPVARDLDIVLLDTASPFGNGHLIPRGSLREPPSALRRADIVLLTKTDGAAAVEALKATVSRYRPQALVLTTRYWPKRFELWPAGISQPLSALQGIPVGVLAGIADPASFEALLDRLGIKTVITRRFMDHHPYTCQELQAMAAACRRAGVEWVVTTLKDAVRFPSVALDGVQVAVLHVAIEIPDEEELFQRVLAICRR